jgi:hypothetical protein
LAQKRFSGLGEQSHVHRSLAAAQRAAQGDHLKLMQVVRMAAPRIFNTLPIRCKLFQRFNFGFALPIRNPRDQLLLQSPGAKVTPMVQLHFQVRLPWRYRRPPYFARFRSDKLSEISFARAYS